MKNETDIRRGRHCVFLMHVHLLINYPPKLAISNLVNSFKGVSSRSLRRCRPDIAQGYYYKGSCGAPISIIRRYMEQQQTLN